MRRFVVAVIALCALATPAFAVNFVTATPAQGAAILTTDDVYTGALTPADFSIRLHGPGGLAELKQLYRASTLAWSDAELARLNDMLARHQAQLASVSALLPETVYLVKDTARVDGGLPHTRGAAIMFGPNLPASDADLDALFLHELFHVLSRAQVARQDSLYALIGLQRCSHLDLPAEMRAHIVTNPDAPLVQHAAPGATPGVLITPVLLAEPARWEADKPSFTDYFSLHFVALRRTADGGCASFVERGKVREVGAADAARLLVANADANTDYFFHPEEILADNFSQMLMGRRDAPNPEIYQRLAAWLGIAQPRN